MAMVWWLFHQLMILREKDSITTTIVSLSTLTAACKGVSPVSSRHLTSAPESSSNFTIWTCLPRIALCRGVLPNESGEFTSGEESVVKLIHNFWPSSLHCIAYIALLAVHKFVILAAHCKQPLQKDFLHYHLQACSLRSFTLYISLKLKLIL